MTQSTAMTTRTGAPPPATIESHWTSEELALIHNLIAPGTTPQELKLLLYTCHRTGLDPLLKQVYAIVRGQGERRRMTIQLGIDGYRVLAARSRVYAGSDDYRFDEGVGEYAHLMSGRGAHPEVATATVWRMVEGQRMGFTASARWAEYCPPSGQDSMWQKMPYQMLGKCAEAAALRKGFPSELAGLYVKEEMERADAIEGEYREMPAAPPPVARAASVPRELRQAPGPLIEREDDPRWGYWASLSGYASAHGVRIPLIGLPVSVAAYQSAKAALIRTLTDQGLAGPAGDPDTQGEGAVEGYPPGEETTP